MNYEVSEKKGPSARVALRETGEGQYEVNVEGRSVRVDVAQSAPAVFSIIEDGQQFEVMFDEKGSHGFDVLVAGRLFHLESVDERTKLLSGAVAAAASGPQTVTAEMPGKVVKIAVEPGASVGEGQGVLVIEAMKMENEIQSPIEGVVKEIQAAEGQTVEPGAVLFVVEPLAEAGDKG